MTYHRVAEFDVWRPGYAGASVTVYIQGTTTKAALYSDIALTQVLDNPQILDTLSQNNVQYGRFLQAVYTASPYYLDIDGEQTGVEQVPLFTLVGEDASDAEVTTTAGSRARPLDDRFDDWINTLDYGALSATETAANDATLTAAIGAAAANGGGIVRVPAGTWPFNDLTLSAGVILMGEGRGVTTLQCQTADNCITLSGDGAGLARLTHDGVALVTGGVGVFAKAIDETVLHDVEIKRFETGIHFKGGRRADWRGLFIDNCATGAKLHGDTDAGGGADGDDFRDNLWVGGKVGVCSTIGVHLSYEDAKCWNNTIEAVGFESNTGTAVSINGAQRTALRRCWWTGNTTNVDVDDDTDTEANPDNEVVSLHVGDGLMNGGEMTLDGRLAGVVFERVAFENVDINLPLPENNVLARDCTEDADVTLTGTGTAWLRWSSTSRGASSGVTTDATATMAWQIELAAGQVVFLTGRVIGNQRDGENTAEYYIGVSAWRPGDELDYENQTADFTVGDVLTGATSGATARIVADSDSGSTGTLTLRDIVGAFLDGETITDTAGGSAEANGVLTVQDAALLGSVTALRAAREDVAGWDATFVADGNNIELRVTGAASTTIEWVADVDVVSS